MNSETLARRAAPLLAALSTAAAALLLPATAQAGRPFTTEDAGLLGAGECEWESVAARTRVQGEPTERALSTQLGCGFGFKTQAALAFGRSSVESERTRAWALGLKTGLLDGGDDGTSLTLAYGADVARGPEQASYHSGSTFVTLVASRPLGGDWTGHANLGWTQDRSSRRDSATWALAAEWALNGQFDIGAEAYGDDRDKPWLGTGVRWTLSKAWSLNASYAVNAESPRAKLASVGFKLAF